MPAKRPSFLKSEAVLEELSPEKYVSSFRLGFDENVEIIQGESSRRVELLVDSASTDANELLSRARKEDGARVDADLQAARERGVAVAGAGLMGISIVATFLEAEFPTTLYDPIDVARESAPERAARELATLRASRGVAVQSPDEEREIVEGRVQKLLTVVDRIDAIADRPVVVESIPEKIKLKRKFYRDLGAVASAPITLLTNTSSLQIDELASELPSAADNRAIAAERFAGFHFFHPATKRSPIEIARGSQTSGETLAFASALARATKKLPFVVKDAPGFLVNRLLQAYLNESLALLDENVAPERLESIALASGFEGAPLRVLDEIGLDVSLRSGLSFLKAFPTRTHASGLLAEMTGLGRLGRKSGLGFYRYESRESWRDDATLAVDAAFLASLRASSPIQVDASVDSSAVDDETLALRIAIAILFEAGRAVEEGVARSFREADAALVLALGFPASKGGIVYWSLASGLGAVLDEAKRFRALGERFETPLSLRRFADAI